MEAFIRQVPWQADHIQVQRGIASVLHSAPEYNVHNDSRPGQRLNFKVHLLPDRKGTRKHGGVGKITFPSVEVGSRFLQDFGGQSPLRTIFVGNRQLRFEPSRDRVRKDIIEELNRLPYADPAAKEKMEKKKELFESKRVLVRTIQFGWITREYSFSPEWQRSCDTTTAYMLFDEEARALRIKVEEAECTRIIIVRFSNIFFHTSGRDPDGWNAVFFSLELPPVFETEATRLELDLASIRPFFKGSPYDEHPRRRHSAFDDHHALTSAYTSCALRLVCRGKEDLDVFRGLSREAGLSDPHDYILPVIPQARFCSSVIAAFDEWLQDLDWTVAFQLEAATRAMIIDLKEALSLRSRIAILLAEKGARETASLLQYFRGEMRKLNTDGTNAAGQTETVEQCFLRCMRDFIPKRPSRRDRLSDDVFDCFHIYVTPSSFILSGPFPERSNRVVRSYPSHTEHFVRVSFVDENHLQYRFEREVDGRAFLKERVGRMLHEGLHIAGTHLEFLAYSQSALREASVWFIRPFVNDRGNIVNASSIIESLGTFHEVPYDTQMAYCPARFGARVSQAFTATDQSIQVEAEEILIKDDIERSGSNFTDGVGTISAELAALVRKALYHKRRRRRRPVADPTTFQIRLQGAKGMLSVDHSLKGRTIYLRPSMIKFEAPHSLDIEIAQAFDRPSRYFLNRPLIMLLEGLGVPYEVFKIHQDAAIRNTQNAAKDMALAARMLEGHGLGASFRLTSVMIGLQKIGVDTLGGFFYRRMMEYAVHHVLREMKHHARIPIPGGWTLPGVADVHGYLSSRQISVCVRCPDCRSDVFLKGPTLVSRSPTIAPGDVQVLIAVEPEADSPFAIEPLTNSIVFSTRGSRSVPSCLGGGDLDGDMYNVWCPRYFCPCIREWRNVPGRSLIPLKAEPPASYTPAPKRLVNHQCTMKDVADFFVDYISNDVVGIIATNWLIIADQSPKSIYDPDCIRLAELHSDAVDFPKSGTPVQIKSIPRLKFKTKPDWNAPETIKPDTVNYYESQKAIGKLFRDVDLPAVEIAQSSSRQLRRQLESDEERPIEELMAEMGLNAQDDALGWLSIVQTAVESRVAEFIDLHEPRAKEVSSANDIFRNYASQLREICADHSISQSRSSTLTEEEIVIGTIVARTSQTRMRKEKMSSMREISAVIVRDVRDELKGEEQGNQEEWLRRSWVAWKLAIVEHSSFGGMSFWWITLGAVLDAARAIEDRDADLDYP